MLIRYFSDIHLDHEYRHLKNVDSLWQPEELSTDNETTLILAGDLWSDGNVLKKKNSDGIIWMRLIAAKFKHVVFVLGNHDFWGQCLDTEPDKINEKLQEQGLSNCFLLENSSMTLDNVKFVGGTLWTDYGNRDWASMQGAVEYMNDYRQIRIGKDYRKTVPTDMLHIFDKTKKAIFKTQKDFPEQKLIVVTHMAPSYRSVNEKYRNKRDELSNTWYYSNLEGYILDSEIDLWVHGHMHDCSDYYIGNTRVLCNPKGYFQYEDTGYDEVALIEI